VGTNGGHRTSDVNKRWGAFVGVRDLNLSITDKEFLVLLGPSGCGKTTTMRMIAGLEDATSGDILIGGRRVNHLDPKDRDIAMVFQSYALYPNLSVYENIRFPLRVRRIPQSEHDARVRRAARWSSSTTFSTAAPPRSREGSGSASPWPAPSSVSPPFS
jgi:multiple sugar transport system ATP-binding protein